MDDRDRRRIISEAHERAASAQDAERDARATLVGRRKLLVERALASGAVLRDHLRQSSVEPYPLTIRGDRGPSGPGRLRSLIRGDRRSAAWPVTAFSPALPLVGVTVDAEYVAIGRATGYRIDADSLRLHDDRGDWWQYVHEGDAHEGRGQLLVRLAAHLWDDGEELDDVPQPLKAIASHGGGSLRAAPGPDDWPTCC